MTDEELKRLLGMGSRLDRLSASEIEALKHRVRGLQSEQRARVEAILLRDLCSTPDLARRICRSAPNSSAGDNGVESPRAAHLRVVKRLALVFITIHSFAVTIAVMHFLGVR